MESFYQHRGMDIFFVVPGEFVGNVTLTIYQMPEFTQSHSRIKELEDDIFMMTFNMYQPGGGQLIAIRKYAL